MTESRAKALIAAITSTLFDLGGESPESPIYLALGADLNEYEHIRYILTELGMVTVKGNVLTLTAQGRKVGEECSKVYSEAKAGR